MCLKQMLSLLFFKMTILVIFNSAIYHHMEPQSLCNLVWKEGDYYVAQCKDIDVSSFGETEEEALQNLEEALSLFLED